MEGPKKRTAAVEDTGGVDARSYMSDADSRSKPLDADDIPEFDDDDDDYQLGDLLIDDFDELDEEY